MSRYVCTRKCQFRGRRWRVGESLVAKEGEKLPPYFVSQAQFDPEEVPAEPRSLKAVQEAAQAAKPVTGMAAKPEAVAEAKAKTSGEAPPPAPEGSPEEDPFA